MASTVYLVKDLARATGHFVYTVEYYLKKGLLKEVGRGPHTQYRHFNEQTVDRLNAIRKLRGEGKGLEEIRELLS